MQTLSERPCLNLQLLPGSPAFTDIPAVPGTKAQAICHCTDESKCPKKKLKLNITMLCFRIQFRHERKKDDGGAQR